MLLIVKVIYYFDSSLAFSKGKCKKEGKKLQIVNEDSSSDSLIIYWTKLKIDIFHALM